MRSSSTPVAVLRLLPLLVGSLLTSCGAPPPPEIPWHIDVLRGLDLQGRASQLVVAGMPSNSQGAPAVGWGPSHAGAIGGVLLKSGSAAAAAATLRELRASAPIPLLVMIDLDAGEDALQGLTPFPPVRSVAGLAAVETAREVAEQVGREARAVGAGVGFLRLPPTNAREPLSPVARDPERLSAGLAAYLDGLAEARLLVAVHALWRDSLGITTLDWDRARLTSVELATLEPIVRREPAALGLGAVRVAALTSDTLPLALSPVASRGLLRRDLGFEGVIMADLSPSSAIAAEYGEAEGAVRAVSGGADLVVGVNDPASVVAALTAAVGAGRLPAARIADAAERVLALKARAGELQGDTTGVAPLPAVTSTPNALRLARLAGRLPYDPEAADSPSVRLPGTRWPAAPTLAVAPAQTVGMSEARLAEVDRHIRSALADSVFTGAAVAIGRRGGLVRLRGYGRVGEGDGGQPVSAESTIFDIASLSKVVGTTSAVALLVEDRRMGLDAPVRRYLPELQGSGKDDVTIRHLLTHTSGLPAGIWLYGATASPSAAVARVLEQPLRRPPGQAVEYSDLGMILLAEAAERAAEMPLDHYLALRLFAPLGMASTMYLPPATLRDRTVPTATRSEREFVLHGVVHDGNAFRLGGVAGHAGLFSTARDLAVFAQTILNGGSYGSTRVLAPGTVRAFTTRQPRADQRALGWDTPSPGRSSAGAYFSARSYGHTGYTGTSLWIDPEAELFVVLLTNRTYPEASPREILQLRAAVHDAAARAITDRPVRPRGRSR